MEKQNLQFLLAAAIIFIIYLINRPKGVNGGPVKTVVGGAVEKLSMGAIKRGLGMTGQLRVMYKNEDTARETVLISLGDAAAVGCPSGFELAPKDFTLSNGGCHVTCGGNGTCGVGPKGLDSDGEPVLQICCIARN